MLYPLKTPSIMNKILIRLAALTLTMTAAVAARPQTWLIGSPIPANVTATLSNGTLTFSGSGQIGNCGRQCPWVNSPVHTIVIENGITNIPDTAVSTDIQVSPPAPLALRIAESVTTIGRNAFGYISNTMAGTINCLSPSPPVCGQDAFLAFHPTNSMVYVPQGTEAAYRQASGWNRFGNNIVAKYTVTFNSQGGTEIAEQRINTGGTVIEPSPKPTKNGYKFDKWYKNVECTQIYTFSLPVTGNLTLYAKWLPVYTVVFNSMGGTKVDTQYIISGSAVPRPQNPSRNRYTFDQWYKEEGLINPYTFSDPITGNITLYAKWLFQYKVTFDTQRPVVNPNTDRVPSQFITSGNRVQEPSFSGYCLPFEGWYKEASCINRYNFTLPVTTNFTLYAKYNGNYIICNSAQTINLNTKYQQENCEQWYKINLQRVNGKSFEINLYSGPEYVFAIYQSCSPADQQQFILQGASEARIDLPSGMYYIKVHNNNNNKNAALQNPVTILPYPVQFIIKQVDAGSCPPPSP